MKLYKILLFVSILILKTVNIFASDDVIKEKLSEISKLKNTMKYVYKNEIKSTQEDSLFKFFSYYHIFFNDFSKEHIYARLENGTTLENGSILYTKEKIGNQELTNSFEIYFDKKNNRIIFFSSNSEINDEKWNKQAKSIVIASIITLKDNVITTEIIISLKSNLDLISAKLIGSYSTWDDHNQQDINNTVMFYNCISDHNLIDKPVKQWLDVNCQTN